MSSTDSDTAAHQAIGDFFDAVLLPLAQARHDRAQTTMPLGPDPRLASYWTALPERRLALSDMLQPSCLDAQALAKALAEHWRSVDEPDLVALAAPLVTLAQALRRTHAAPDDPSAFIYTMY